jgi:hypothetical protein
VGSNLEILEVLKNIIIIIIIIIAVEVVGKYRESSCVVRKQGVTSKH